MPSPPPNSFNDMLEQENNRRQNGVTNNDAGPQKPSNGDVPERTQPQKQQPTDTPNGSVPDVKPPPDTETSTPAAGDLIDQKKPLEPRVSGWAKSLLSAPDSLLLRLKRHDLSSIVSTFSYVLSILAFIHIKLHRAHAHMHAARHNTPAHEVVLKHTSSLGVLAALLWRARLTLRLFGLLPIYAKARRVFGGSKQDGDRALFLTSLIQCSLFGVSQLLENLAFLHDSRVHFHRLTSRVPRRHHPHHAHDSSYHVYTFAYRFWFLAVSCDLVRSFRKLQIMSQREDPVKSDVEGATTDAETKDQDQARSWSVSTLLPLAWFPVGWQLSSWFEDSMPGFNIGLFRAASAVFDVERSSTLWSASKAS